MGFTTFDEMRSFRNENEAKFKELSPKRNRMAERIIYLEKLLDAYKDYEPYIKYHK